MPILDFPISVFVVSLGVLWLSVFLGRLLAVRYRKRHAPDWEDLGLLTNSSLTLLALIIGFSFSMAMGRYDQRKNYEEEEANAIGTEYVRADLLPPSDAAQIRSLLSQFLDKRLLFYSVRDQDRLEQVDRETASLESEMWATVQAAATAKPTMPITLVVSGMNDVLNRAGYTEAAWRYRVPLGAWSTMVVLSIGCCALIGFNSHRQRLLLGVFPALIAISLFFIADIDSPRDGVIRVVPQNLISLAKALRTQ